MRKWCFCVVATATLVLAVKLIQLTPQGQTAAAGKRISSGAVAGVRGFLGPDGKLREPELEEQAQAATAVESSVNVVTLANGTLAAELPPEMMSYSVATVDGNGKVKLGEVRGLPAAASFVATGKPEVRLTPAGKENLDVR